MKKYILIVIMMGAVGMVEAQQEAPNIRRGNRDYNKENYTEAEVNYRRALETKSQSYQGQYNLGNALFKQNKYPEAAEAFGKAAQLIDPKKEKTKAAATYHNLGNAYFAQQQYDKAIAAYQQSLRANPKDNDTRYNMVKAMQLLEQQQQEQQQQNENQNKDQNKQQQQQEQQQEQQQQQQEQQETQMDKETAEQILQALEQDEQETQDKLQRVQGQSKRVEKEW